VKSLLHDSLLTNFQLVGKELSRTSMNQEVLISSNSYHDGVCALELGSEARKGFTKLIDDIIAQETDP